MMDGIKVTQLIHVAAVLGLADLLREGPRTSDDLAAAAGAHPGALYRVLRALASLGIFREVDGQRFALTPLAEPLRSDVPGSVKAWATVCGTDWHLRMWSDILYSVKTGLGAFPHMHGGMGSFEYFQQHPEAGAVFYQAMTDLTAQVSAAVLAAYDFSGARRIVDVGCGNGTFTEAILNAHPHLTALLFDIPPVIEAARGVLGAAGLSERCEFAAGDFFTSVPSSSSGGDAYVLKNIVHDWSDERGDHPAQELPPGDAGGRPAADRRDGGAARQRPLAGQDVRHHHDGGRRRPGAHRGRAAQAPRRRRLRAGAGRPHPLAGERDRGAAGLKPVGPGARRRPALKLSLHSFFAAPEPNRSGTHLQ